MLPARGLLISRNSSKELTDGFWDSDLVLMKKLDMTDYLILSSVVTTAVDSIDIAREEPSP